MITQKYYSLTCFRVLTFNLFQVTISIKDGVISLPNYKEMYLTLFNAVTDALELLKQAQQKSEEIYIETDTDNDVKL